jgi:hypothetical protein
MPSPASNEDAKSDAHCSSRPAGAASAIDCCPFCEINFTDWTRNDKSHWDLHRTAPVAADGGRALSDLTSDGDKIAGDGNAAD